MSKDEFTRLRKTVEAFSVVKVLSEFMLSKEYDGPPLAAIIRASAEGGLKHANHELEYAWIKLEEAAVGSK